MKTYLASILSVIFVIGSGSLYASERAENFRTDGHAYAGIQYSIFDYDNGLSETFEPSGIILRAGGEVSDNLSIEARFGYGTHADTDSNVTLEIDRLVGLYGLFRIGSRQNFSAYLLGGYTELVGTASNQVSSLTETDHGLSGGIGMELFGFNAEFVQYITDKKYDVISFSIGYKAKF